MKPYTQIERDAIRYCLQAAKAQMRTGEDVRTANPDAAGKPLAICFAIGRSGYSDETVAAASQVIMSRLAPHIMLPAYVKAMVDDSWDGSVQEHRAEMQDFRHRWLDSIIEEFSK